MPNTLRTNPWCRCPRHPPWSRSCVMVTSKLRPPPSSTRCAPSYAGNLERTALDSVWLAACGNGSIHLSGSDCTDAWARVGRCWYAAAPIGLTGRRARTHNQALELELETYSTYIQQGQQRRLNIKAVIKDMVEVAVGRRPQAHSPREEFERGDPIASTASIRCLNGSYPLAQRLPSAVCLGARLTVASGTCVRWGTVPPCALASGIRSFVVVPLHPAQVCALYLG